jgi:mycofactocin precursor peptide peptidase
VNRLASLRSDQAAGQILAVPLGATEQHGPHLPMGTDTVIATALVSRLAARVPGVVAAPALPYGSSGEHQDFAGTLSLGFEAMEHLLIELGRSASETYPRLLFVSAHGGNFTSLQRAVDRLRHEGRDVLPWTPARAFGGDAHAGETETSLMLALAPETVHMDRAAVGNVEPLHVLLPALIASGMREVSDNGVLGDPTTATMQRGQALMETAVDALVAFVRAWPPR